MKDKLGEKFIKFFESEGYTFVDCTVEDKKKKKHHTCKFKQVSNPLDENYESENL